jgi:hypothetical protein
MDLYESLTTSWTMTAYVFWSIFTSLIPTLFYFSVWELGIAGHELALLSTLSPILLGISPIFEWARTQAGRTYLHLLSFSGLAAYALTSPLHRLLLVTYANISAVLRLAVDWTDVDGNGMVYHGLCW